MCVCAAREIKNVDVEIMCALFRTTFREFHRCLEYLSFWVSEWVCFLLFTEIAKKKTTTRRYIPTDAYLCHLYNVHMNRIESIFDDKVLNRNNVHNTTTTTTTTTTRYDNGTHYFNQTELGSFLFKSSQRIKWRWYCQYSAGISAMCCWFTHTHTLACVLSPPQQFSPCFSKSPSLSLSHIHTPSRSPLLLHRYV